MTLSLIIPVHNEIDQLDYTLKKLIKLKTKINQLEFVFIDDFSTDGTFKFLKKYSKNKKFIKLIRNKIGFKKILISDDLSMKSLKKDLKFNTIRTFSSGCNIALHCNGKINEMTTVASNSPLVDSFIIQKTSEFYKILR